MMATGAKKPAAAIARRQQQQALFAAKHAELLSEARGVARDFGALVCSVAFCPGDAGAGPRAVENLFVGRETKVLDAIRREVQRDVSEMGPEEATAHERRLRALRDFVVRELEAKKKADAAAAAAAGGDAVKRAPEQQETAGAGYNMRRVD